MAKLVSVKSEQRIRAIFGAVAGGCLTSPQLTAHLRIAADDAISRQAIYMAISAAHTCGLLLRDGKFPRFHYSINPKWKRGAVRPTRAHAGDRVRSLRPSAQAGAYTGPAFDSGSLVPAIGPRPADPEVMPPEIAELIDSLHGRFFRHAHGGEA